jgi:chromosome partitioning protein
VDADPNQTLLQAIRRGRPEGVSVDTATDDTILPALTEAAKKAALVVVDLAGSTNQAMLYAVGKANLVLIPAQPSSFDIVEALKTHAVIDKASDLTGRRILYRVVLTRVPVLRQRVVDHSRRQFKERGLELLKVELMERAAFRLMTFTGRPPAEEDPEGGAAQNVAALADELAAQLGMVDA